MKKFLQVFLLLGLLFLASVNAKKLVALGQNGALATTDNLANANKGAVVDFPLGYYFFYYGDFSASSPNNVNTPAIVKQFVEDISNTAYMNILTQYTSGTTGKPVNIVTRYIGETFITGYPFGKTIATGQSSCMETLLKTWLDQYKIKVDNTVQYYIVISDDVSVATGGVCGEDGDTCGYHTQADQLGGAKKVLWGYLNSQCGPNGPYTKATNAVLDTLSHEIFETLSDPYLDAWQNTAGKEIGDLCEDGQYGTTYPSQFKQGAKYNLKLNGHEYMVQTEWSNEVSACVNFRNFTTAPATPAATISISPGASLQKSKASTVSISFSPSSLASLSTGASPYSSQSVQASVSVAKSGKVTSSSSVALTPTNSPIPVFPSAQASVSPGSSASQTLPIQPSSSVKASLTSFPSIDPAVGACLNCYRPKCHKYAKIQKLCQTKFGGTFTVTPGSDGAVACCTKMSNTSASFGWTDLSLTLCEYTGIVNKKRLFCAAIGGHVTCQERDGKGVRYTCTR